MKKLLPFFLFSLLLIVSARAGITAGQQIDVTDLAQHLGVQSWPLQYVSKQPFKGLSILLGYYERDASGEMKRTRELAFDVRYTDGSKTTEKLTVLVDANRATVVTSSNSSTGKGMPIAESFTSHHTPTKDANGQYLLLQNLKPGATSNDPANVMSEIRLEVTELK